MGTLGIPFRVVYEGKNFRTGLTNVVAAVLRPDNIPLGPFPMVEMGSPFGGRYAFDLNTTLSSPEGEYIAMIVSPSDGIQTTRRISLYKAPAVYSNRMSTSFNPVTSIQEVIAWCERAGQVVTAASACTVTVKTADGTTVWTATLASPNADGVFRFTNTITPTLDVNYYVLITITADGGQHTSQQPFFTAG